MRKFGTIFMALLLLLILFAMSGQVASASENGPGIEVSATIPGSVTIPGIEVSATIDGNPVLAQVIPPGYAGVSWTATDVIDAGISSSTDGMAVPISNTGFEASLQPTNNAMTVSYRHPTGTQTQFIDSALIVKAQTRNPLLTYI
ncbi:hypothetical protein LCGC14_1521240 [marine sediment metagenome]|uniref:Uncharacterized protein n=1 Tax=marine sediment metagenome TaxID=412755 RepID=A0A0F9IYK5_9ZZZZ